MKKYGIICALFAVIVTVCFFVCMRFDAQTPSLENGTALPADISDQSYVLSGLVYNAQAGGYPIQFETDGADESIAIICMARTMALYQAGELIHTFDEQSPYTRTIIVPIEANPVTGQIDLLFTDKPRDVGVPSLFRSAAGNAPQIIIGPLQSIERATKASSEITFFLVGMYAIIAFSGLVLFLRKRTERYLLYMSIVSCIALMTTLITTGVDLIHISYREYMLMRPWLFIVPVTLNSAICLYIFSEDLSQRLKRWITPFGIFLLAAVAIFIQSTTPLVTYHLMRRLLWVPMLITFASAIDRHRIGSAFFFLAYAISEAIALYMYQANLMGPIGAFSIYIRLTELGNILFLVACMTLTLNRFAGKFGEAEHLSHELAHLNAHLTDKVAERTQQLQAQQEQKHNLMLNIFHDLRSPIFIIRERLAHLNPANEEDAESISIMDTRLGYMQRLTEELFLSAKLESNAVLFEEDLVDLDEMLSQLARDYMPTARERDIALSYTSDGPCSTWGDAFRLEQAIQNLISNALAYTPEGGSVHILLQQQGKLCSIHIRDTGKGIPEEELPRVFERYYRVGPQNHDSSGLGLSIARDIVIAHRGEITVHSKLNEGSEFIVTLRAVDSH